MPVHHSSQVLDRIPKDFTLRWFALQACSFHACKDFVESINVVFQVRCRYDYVIHVTHHEIPVLLSHSGQSLSHQRQNRLKGRTQVQCCEELGITKFREDLVYSRYRVRIFYRYRVQVKKVATNHKLPPFFFAIATQQAHGDFEGSIMSYSSNISNSAWHASDLCGVIRLAPYLWGTAPSSSSISCSATDIRLMP